MQIPHSIAVMLEILQSAGFQAFLVGGCVRDAVLGIAPHDFDITTDARPEQIIALFGQAHCTEYGRAFGTVGVKYGGSFAEITTFRTEADYTDSRHPGTVTFAQDLLEDLSRRDFTCNAMAYAPDTGLVDPFGGKADLEHGVLRCVGVPQQRFREDALRILRGMRFCARFGMTPDPLTDAAMRAGAFRLQQISAERVFSELQGILMGEQVTRVLLSYPQVLAVRIPEIMPCIAFSQHSRHHDFTVWAHIARAVGAAPQDPVVRMAMLLHDIGKPSCFTMDEKGGHFKGHAAESAKIADRILLRLRCDNAQRKLVTKLVYLHRDIPQDLRMVRRLLGTITYAEFSQFLDVLRADNRSKRTAGYDMAAEEKIQHAAEFAAHCQKERLCCRVQDLDIRGTDLMALGLQGREIGRALQHLLEAVISGKCENRKEALVVFFTNCI